MFTSAYVDSSSSAGYLSAEVHYMVKPYYVHAQCISAEVSDVSPEGSDS